MSERYVYNLGDTGCEVAPDCLKCPLKECRFDHEPPLFYPSSWRRWVAMRERFIVLSRTEHMPFSKAVTVIAQEQGVSPGGVRQAFRRMNELLVEDVYSDKG